MSRCIPCQILHTNIMESFLAFSAFVTASARQTVARGDARETEVKREVKAHATTDDLFLGQFTERDNNLHRKIQCITRCDSEVAEELGRGVGERIMPKRADGNGVDLVERAEDSDLREQHQVTAGEIDSFVRSFCAGNMSAGCTPVVSVQIVCR